MKICVVFLALAVAFAAGQRVMTIQLDAVQYFISRMNPYSPTLNYYLAYQYCRSLGLQLVSFETTEKADSLTTYLKNAGYKKYSFWTSGNKLGTDMFMWMSSGVPFNMTFDYMLKNPGNKTTKVPPGTEPQRVARESGNSTRSNACVAMGHPNLAWEVRNCLEEKDFICEQTRCYYYNYGSIPVSATQGNRRPYLTTTTSPTNDIDNDAETNKDDEKVTSEEETGATEEEAPNFESDTSSSSSSSTSNDLDNDEVANTDSSDNERLPEDPVVGRLMTTAGLSEPSNSKATVHHDDEELSVAEDKDSSASLETAKATRPVDIPDITSLFTDGPLVKSRKETAFDGLETHEVRSSSRSNVRAKLEHRETPDNLDYEISPGSVVTEAPDSALEDSHTVGPYDSVHEDYVNDQPDGTSSPIAATGEITAIAPEKTAIVEEHQQQQDEESSTFIPEPEPDYRYNMKWRSMGKVLDPPSK